MRKPQILEQGGHSQAAASSSASPPAQPSPPQHQASRPKRIRTSTPKSMLSRYKGHTTTSKAKHAGTFECRYCHKNFSFAMHRYNCQSMPFAVWHDRVTAKRARGHTPEQVAGWKEMCPHCRLAFPSERAVRSHKTLCRHRRLAAGMPVAK
mmetsp:Transcript_58918/g.192210  ORF Transcript_58918/g.192210 Transcript_58918/m.192210 type:complete len:151 (-) Transcript_58918:423-875(-)